jgi:hypothetical protein
MKLRCAEYGSIRTTTPARQPSRFFKKTSTRSLTLISSAISFCEKIHSRADDHHDASVDRPLRIARHKRMDPFKLQAWIPFIPFRWATSPKPSADLWMAWATSPKPWCATTRNIRFARCYRHRQDLHDRVCDPSSCKSRRSSWRTTKRLAAQLYAEFKEFFPENAVSYFVSYYDYYQPEAYVPRHDLFIEKGNSDQRRDRTLRLAATTPH